MSRAYVLSQPNILDRVAVTPYHRRSGVRTGIIYDDDLDILSLLRKNGLDRRVRLIQEKHRQGFPEMLDLLVVCTEAGIGVEAAIDRVGRELTHLYPHLSTQIHLFNLELRAGRSFPDALDRFADNLGIEEARSFATLIQQSQELGTSLVDALRVYSDEMRDKRLARAEEKAHALPAKLVLPLGFCIFPVMLVVTMLPVILRISKVFF